MVSESWESRGTVWLDGTYYLIKELCDSDCYAPGTRFVSLSLVEVAPRVAEWVKQAHVDMAHIEASGEDLSAEPDEWGYGPDGEIVDLR